MTHAVFPRLARARARLSRFCGDQRASVVPIFAFAMIPILALTGTAVDYSRANSARTAVQAALDATALILSKEAVGMDETVLKTKATNYFFSNFSNVEAKNVTVTPFFTTPQSGSFNLVVTANGTVDLHFMAAFGQSSMPISATTEVKWGIKRLELALVLDNTGSMASSSKMTNLKLAAKNLLTTMKTAAKKVGDIKVSIIPFDVTVKPGNGYKNAFWIDFNQNDISKNSWEGCVQDRDRTANGTSINNNTKDTAPVDGDDHTYFPAVQCGSLVSMMPLTDVYEQAGFDSLNTKIDSMTPAGNTNTTIGLVWGWHSLTANLPFPQGSALAPDLDKVIIMLTDGDNTEDRWSTTQSQIDARMKMTCDNLRDTKTIRVYTVRVINGNADLLRDCATNPNMYYNVQQADQLNSVFTSIAQNLANLRLSK